MKREQIIEILEKYDIDEYHWKLEIADEILALPLDVPNDEEKEEKIDEKYFTIDHPHDYKEGFNDCFKWLKSEIIKRNK